MVKDAVLLVIGLLILVVIPLMFVDAARDLRASNGEGRPGTLVVEGEDCGGKYFSSCRARGTWTSDDGLTVLADMALEVGNHPLGETVPGLVLVDEGDGGAVYPLGYSRGIPVWAWSFLYLPLGTAFIVVGALGIRGWRNGDR